MKKIYKIINFEWLKNSPMGNPRAVYTLETEKGERLTVKTKYDIIGCYLITHHDKFIECEIKGGSISAIYGTDRTKAIGW